MSSRRCSPRRSMPALAARTSRRSERSYGAAPDFRSQLRHAAHMLAAFSITPLGAGDSVGAAVADAVRLVRQSGLPNETNSMFTNVEGEWDEVMALLKRCVDTVA